MNPTPLWIPDGRDIGRANLTRFIWAVDNEYGPGLAGCAALYQWSVEKPLEFWPAVWEFCEVRASVPWERVRTGQQPMTARGWFPGARLNFAENLLRLDDERPALIARSDDDKRVLVSFTELRQRVLALSTALLRLGIEPGTHMAGCLPNRPELVVATLSAATVGAVWAAMPDHLDRTARVERLENFAPAVLVVPRVDEDLGAVLEQLASVRHVLVLDGVDEPFDVPPGVEILHYATLELTTPATAEFAQLPFDHPLFASFVVRADGSTDAVVHSAGGTLLGHLKELSLHTDVHSDDRLLYLSETGSTLWYWALTALALGASLVLYDSSQGEPNLLQLRTLLDQEDVSIFGCGERYLASLSGTAPSDPAFALPRLTTVLCDGMELPTAALDRVYELIKPEVRLSAMATSEDLMGCLALGNPDIPVFRGQLQCRGLGIQVQTVNAAGQPVQGGPGVLVCTAPFPSLPLGLWNDPAGVRYRRTYLEGVPGSWTTGQQAEITDKEGLILHGRVASEGA